MNIISACCKSSIEEGTRHEHPTGDRFSQAYKVFICTECETEADVIEACDHCGEPFDSKGPIKTELGDWCAVCVSNEVDDRTEAMKKEMGIA